MPQFARTGVRPAPSGLPTRNRFPAALLLGAALLVSSCQRQANEANQANRAEATAEPSAPAPNAPATAPTDGSLGAEVAANRQRLVADAVSALQETYAALALIAAGKNDEALTAIQRATGKLETVTAADPNMAMAPVDVSATIHDLIATPQAVADLRRQAEAALAAGRLQEARRLIADLASEHVITVTSLPLATYPDALKQAAAQIHAGNPLAARTTLEAALGTLVVEETIIPLPIVRAEALLDEARPLAEKQQRTPAENDRLHRLLGAARLQLDLARALGYATKDDLDAMYDELGKIEKTTKGQGFATGLFDRIKALFTKTRHEAAQPQR